MLPLPSFHLLAQSSLPAGNGATPTPPAPTPAAPTPPAPAHPDGGAAPISTAPGQPGAGTQQAPPSSNPLGVFLPIILLVVVVYLFMFRGQRKDEKTRKKMIEQMKKGDRVMTIGGMIGSVVDIRGDEVVLKVDEANNVKARYIKSAIQKVLDDDAKIEDKK